MRVRAASLLQTLDPARDTAAAIRPAPTTVDAATIASSPIVSPPYSTHVYVDTDKGTFQIELAVLDAPLTVVQLHHARAQGLLRRAQHSSRRARLRPAGRRSARRRRRRAGLHAARRDQRAPVPARHGRHGARLEDTGGSQVPSSPTVRSRTWTGATPCSARSSAGWRSSSSCGRGTSCGACACGTACSSSCTKNGGANLRAPRRTGLGCYRFLAAAFFFPPLAAFFAMRIPPFIRVDVRAGHPRQRR